MKKIEGILTVLIIGFGDRGNARVELAAVDSGGNASRSTEKWKGETERWNPSWGWTRGGKTVL
jgi:hypothetical protein